MIQLFWRAWRRKPDVFGFPRRAYASTLAVAWCLLAPATSTADADWKVGLAQIKITPEQPMLLAGYPGRPKVFEKVAQDLHAKALVLEDREGHRGIIVTSDLLGFPAAVAEPICERIQKKTGLKRDQILLNSSHTHAGPQLSLKAPPGEALRNVEYTRQLQDRWSKSSSSPSSTWSRPNWRGAVASFISP
jgi:hypothetical protein